VLKEVDRAADLLVDEVNKRRATLKDDVRKEVDRNLDAREPWVTRMKDTMASAKGFLDSKSNLMGDFYGDHITDDKMTHIRIRCKEKIKDIKRALRKVPLLLKPFIWYNSVEIASAIRSFGSIDVHPPSSNECPVAVDMCSTHPDKPIVIGKRGSSPGEHIYLTYLCCT
jgi:hypothetical protein